MSDSNTLSFPDAARRLGVPVRVLRRAIRAGTVPAPANQGAGAALSPEWVASAQAAVAASPKALSRASMQKVPAFARYEGTSAWRGDRRRVRAYYRFQADQVHG